MSATVDANVLVYASNQADPVHVPARALLEQLAAGPGLVYLFWPALMGYLWIVTHPTVLPRPLAHSAAVANVTALLSLGHVRAPSETEGFWETYRSTAGDRVRGNAVPDATSLPSCNSTASPRSTRGTASTDVSTGFGSRTRLRDRGNE